MTAYDTVLTGGTVVDGTGGRTYVADVGILDGRIAQIGSLDAAQARTTIDARGRLVMPGFVDTHIHADAVLGRPDTQHAVQEAMLRQGITSVILGQDGLSFAPASRATVDYVAAYFAAVDGPPPAELADGCTVGGLLDFYDRRTALNVAFLVPLGTVRHEVLGPDDRAGDAGAPRHGPAGLRRARPGSGRDLDRTGVRPRCVRRPRRAHRPVRPGRRGRCAVRQPSAQLRPGRRTRHDRGPSPRPRGRDTRCTSRTIAATPSRSSPTWTPAGADGVDVTFDTYPHLYGNTILAMRALPPQVQAGGVKATLRRLVDPEVRADLAATWFPSVEAAIATSMFGYVAGAEFRWAEGSTVAEASARSGSFGRRPGVRRAGRQRPRRRCPRPVSGR